MPRSQPGPHVGQLVARDPELDRLAAGRGRQRRRPGPVRVRDAGGARAPRPARAPRRRSRGRRPAAGAGPTAAPRPRRPRARRVPVAAASRPRRRVAPPSRSLPRRRMDPPGATAAWTRIAVGQRPGRVAAPRTRRPVRRRAASSARPGRPRRRPAAPGHRSRSGPRSPVGRPRRRRRSEPAATSPATSSRAGHVLRGAGRVGRDRPRSRPSRCCPTAAATVARAHRLGEHAPEGRSSRHRLDGKRRARRDRREHAFDAPPRPRAADRGAVAVTAASPRPRRASATGSPDHAASRQHAEQFRAAHHRQSVEPGPAQALDGAPAARPRARASAASGASTITSPARVVDHEVRGTRAQLADPDHAQQRGRRARPAARSRPRARRYCAANVSSVSCGATTGRSVSITASTRTPASRSSSDHPPLEGARGAASGTSR